MACSRLTWESWRISAVTQKAEWMKARVLLLTNSAWNVYNFRLRLLEALKVDGYSVMCGASRDEYAERITHPFHQVRMNSKGVNPMEDFILYCRPVRLFRRCKPDVVLNDTPKLNIYGTLAA